MAHVGQHRLAVLTRRAGPSGSGASARPAVLGLSGAALAASAFAAGCVRRLAAAHAASEQAWAEAAAARLAADEARERAGMLGQMAETVRGLISSARPREEVCRAAIELTGAHAAIIYEPRGAGELTCTAMSGLDFGAGPVSVGPTTRARRAFDNGRPVFIAAAREGRVASPELWRAAGCPASVLYQPMLRLGRSLGVLAAGWRQVVPFDGSQCAALALLAHEAAAVIAHADAVDSLTGQARTDALTGLANRRGFEAALAGLLARDAGLAVVKLDVDDFARYNETYGHPAGDRALKAATAAWLTDLRPDDTLARVDSGEFALLLPECAAPEAVAIADRLRRMVPGGQTCSAGVAVRHAGEPAEALLGRVDLALLAAKASGCDRLKLSDGGG